MAGKGLFWVTPILFTFEKNNHQKNQLFLKKVTKVVLGHQIDTFLNEIRWKRVAWGVVIFLKKHYRFAKPIMFANNTPCKDKAPSPSINPRLQTKTTNQFKTKHPRDDDTYKIQEETPGFYG